MNVEVMMRRTLTRRGARLIAFIALPLGICAQASLPPTTAFKGSTVLASVNYAYDNASHLDQVLRI